MKFLSCFKNLFFIILVLMCEQASSSCYLVYENDNTIIYRSSNSPVDLSKQLHETLPKRFGPNASMVFYADDSVCVEFDPQVEIPKTIRLEKKAKEQKVVPKANTETKFRVSESPAKATNTTREVHTKPSPEQIKFCKSFFATGESMVDLYISGTSRIEALQLFESNAGGGVSREIAKKVINASYDDLLAFGPIRNQSARSALKGNMGLQAEIICLKAVLPK